MAEKLQLVAATLPEGVPPPILAPVSSIMGEIMIAGVTGDRRASPMDVRAVADWTVRRRLLAVPGVSQVLALVGGVFAVVISGGVLNVATLVGFTTLFGIAVRNGILLVSHYNHLLAEGVRLDEAVFRGSMERLNPVLMTALSAGLALVPLAFAGGEPGNEIQSPMAIVVLGGLLSAVLLNMLVVPALYLRYGAEVPPRDDEPFPRTVRVVRYSTEGVAYCVCTISSVMRYSPSSQRMISRAPGWSTFA